MTLTVEPFLRLIAGAFVLASVLLAMWIDQRFLWFTLFVGANLVQSAFTGWCPMMTILRRLGVKDAVFEVPGHSQTRAA
jgi:hypothetical protein